jgi:hypothetical protein
MRLKPLILGIAVLACADEKPSLHRSGALADSAIRQDTGGGRVNVSAGTIDNPPVGRGSSAAPRRAQQDTGDYPVLRGLYLNRFAAQSARKMRHLLAVADSTEINAFVVDMKDEFGLNYRSSNPEFRRYEGSGRGIVGNVRALVDSMKAHGVVPIARIVAFKDPVAAEANAAWTIRREDGSVWRDKEGLAWVNTHNKEVWEYNLGVAEELVKFGFEEIQWDYIRFPEPYRSLPKQVFPGATLSKPDILAAFLKEAQERLHRLGARNTADIFGLVTTVRGPLEVGQHWEKISPHVDVVLPMVYPSHYPRGAFGIERPNAEPYEIIKKAIDAAHRRDEALGITRAEHVRPWIQAFSLGQPKYGPEQIMAQKKAIYDAGYKGWVLWSPGSLYDPFIPAFDKTDP